VRCGAGQQTHDTLNNQHAVGAHSSLRGHKFVYLRPQQTQMVQDVAQLAKMHVGSMAAAVPVLVQCSFTMPPIHPQPAAGAACGNR